MNEHPLEHECAHILIVEGYSDQIFYGAFLEHMKRLKGVFIRQLKGQSNIRSAKTLGLYLNKLKLEEKQSIGILLDADNDPQGTAQAIENRLREITGRKVTEGQWHEQEGQARLGFFVVPDTQTKGEVETLTWNAFPADGKHSAMKAAVLEFHEKMKTWAGNPIVQTKAGSELTSLPPMTRILVSDLEQGNGNSVSIRLDLTVYEPSLTSCLTTATILRMRSFGLIA